MINIKNEGKFIGINRIWNTLAEWCDDDVFGYIGDDMIFQTYKEYKEYLAKSDKYFPHKTSASTLTIIMFFLD